MTNQQDVSVRLDDRVRLMSAVLAATDWPLKSQNKKPHGTHLHARSTRKFLEVVKNHPAVQAMQGLLDQNAPLEAFFTFALQLSWPALEMSDIPSWVPPKWNEQLADFYAQAHYGVAMNAGHAFNGTDAVSFGKAGNDRDLFFGAQYVSHMINV